VAAKPFHFAAQLSAPHASDITCMWVAPEMRATILTIIVSELIKMKKLLFICSENKLRSPTAEAIFSAHERIEAIGAGTNSDAATPVSGDLIEWADVILVMEKSHKNKITKKFKDLLKGKRLVVLDIPDNYDYMDEDLIRLLKSKVFRLVQI
jgi:predicted protein tyrosine phosphatase